METKSHPCTKKSQSTAMATKSKRAKVDSGKSPEQVGNDLRGVVARLQSELDVERKSNKQLRREKAVEVQQVREVEQNRCATSQKELATKLHQEKLKELEAQKESLRCRYEAEMVKAIKQKDLEIKKLQRDLQKCQDELKEEIAKRGLSTSARSAFELERAKLLQEIKELTSAKKQLEDALHAASEAEKQKNLEIRQMQENCKLEVAKVEKEAGMEVRKLLEELKSKDLLLAQMDRSQYPDRSHALRQHLVNQPVDELLNLSKELEIMENKHSQKQENNAVPTGIQSITWQKKIYELEKQIRLASGLNHAFIEKNKEVATINNSLEGKIKNLKEENKELNTELTSAKAEMKQMNDLLSGSNLESMTIQLEKLRKQIKEQETIIAQLRFECQEKDRQMKRKINKPKKAVRFLLPGETVPLAPGFDIDDVISDGHHGDDNSVDDAADSMSVDSSLSDATILSSQPSVSDMNLTDDDRELMEPSILLESVEKDYEQLMKEHLTLEQSYASLIHSYSTRIEGDPPPEEWRIERESLNLAIYALEHKVRKCEENEELLRMKLEQITEEKEELEFKVLEHEECFEKIGGDSEILEKNQQLESELLQLQQKLERYEKSTKNSERDVGLQCDCLSAPEEQAEISKAKPDIKVIVTNPACLELSVENLSKLKMTGESLENDSGSEMIQSFSTTSSSGFDETSSEMEEVSLGLDPHPPTKPTKPSADEGKVLAQNEKAASDKEPEKLPSHPVATSTPKKIDVLQKDGSDKNDKGKECSLEMETVIRNFQAMETSWKTTVDKLERQLQQSFLRERIIRDQMVLVEEEKNRRISALQGQIDILEDNETRLSDTIQALENVALGMEALQGQVQSKAVVEELDRDVEELDSRRKQLREEVKELVDAGRILGQVKLHLASQFMPGNSVETTDGAMADAVDVQLGGVEVVTLVAAVEKALHNSIARLENVNQQLEEEVEKERELGQRIRKLETEHKVEVEEEEEESKERKPVNTSEVRRAVVECNQMVSNLAVEELQADLQELRGLLIRLKAVINVDESSCKARTDPELTILACTGNKEAREKLHLDMSLEVSRAAEDWLAITPPGVKIFGDFSERDNDATEFQIRQKVDELEKDCERLQKLVHEEEQVIRDLHFQNLELRESEKNFQQLVERLGTTEEQMHGKMEEMAEDMERLQAQVKQLETRERMARAQVMKHQENEAELEERLELTIEEMQNGKRKMERKMLELENEKKTLIRRTEDQADRIGDLEGLSGSLKLRIRNLEASESNLRSEMRKLEAELSAAAGQLSELEQQKESLVQRLQDLEKEKSKLLFEIADLTMDCNKQGHKISLLNQEIGKLRGSLVNRDEVISCLQAKLEEANGLLDGLRVKMAAYESQNCVKEEIQAARTSVNYRDQKINKTEPDQSRGVSTCHQSTQTNSKPLKAKIVIEKANSAFRESLISLGEHHPHILHEFLSASLIPLLASYESQTDTKVVPKETMKRFIASLQVDFPRNSKVLPHETVHQSNGRLEGPLENGHGLEEEHWSKIEDPRVIHDVRAAENPTYWKDVETRMGLDIGDLALTIEFRDSVEMNAMEKSLPKDVNNEVHVGDTIPPPLPSCSPPPLSPEPHPEEDGTAEESADEASEINDEDDGAALARNSIAQNWKVPYHGTVQHNRPSLTQRHVRPSSSSNHTSLHENHFLRASSVDRDCAPLNQITFRGSELLRMATGSLESITDSGMDSMIQGTGVIPQEAAGHGNRKYIPHKKTQLRDQAIQAGEEEAFDSVIILKTQLDQKERELAAKSNEMDRLSQEMRRWQQEAVSSGEEKARLSALLGCALKDLKVMREGSGVADIKSPTIAPIFSKIPKSPLGFAGWGSIASAERKGLASQIPVSIRHASLSEKDVANRCQTPNARRPTSLHSDLSHSPSCSTDGATNSDSSGSSYASPNQDRRTASYLPRPVKDLGPTSLPPTAVSSRTEADRLFRQSLDSSRNSQSRQSASSPLQSGPELAVDSVSSLQAVEPATSRSVGATIF